MASPYVACRLHLGRRFSLAKNLRKVEAPLKRLVGTNVAAVQGEPLGKDKAGVCPQVSNKRMDASTAWSEQTTVVVTVQSLEAVRFCFCLALAVTVVLTYKKL